MWFLLLLADLSRSNCWSNSWSSGRQRPSIGYYFCYWLWLYINSLFPASTQLCSLLWVQYFWMFCIVSGGSLYTRCTVLFTTFTWLALEWRESGDAVGNLPIVDILIGGLITQIISRDATDWSEWWNWWNWEDWGNWTDTKKGQTTFC